jgi:glycosyltransferase involved in cell wall biosynthesis
MKPLRILMIAPQPFLRPRGTPFSVLHRIRALLKLGHTVDLVTYPFGEDVDLPGLRIVRCRKPLGVGDVPIGPSVAKALTDVPLFHLAWRMARKQQYDLLHTHEEAGALGALLRARVHIPHLYDMHSSLPQQFHNFGRLNIRPVVSSFERLERFTLGRADGVIAICQALADRAQEVGYRGPLAMIENTLDFAPTATTEEDVSRLRERLGLAAAQVVVYTGTLEQYQGLDLLLQAAALMAERRPELRVLIVGGSAEQSAALREQALSCGAGSNVVTLPAVAPREVHLYQKLADILVTTRARGTNTPLKLYQYLRSGRPIVATSIFSHTQVLDARCAELVAPEPETIAAGIERLIDDPERRAELASAAAELARDRYGEERYHALLQGLLDEIVEAASQTPRSMS